jgi:hypothetical protein
MPILPLLLSAGRWLVLSWPGRALMALLTLSAFAAWERHQGAVKATATIRAAEALQVKEATDAGNAAAAAAAADDPAQRLRRGDW